jgi:radical SAM superfamily enzyme YgiQ (UPF0313 family)
MAVICEKKLPAEVPSLPEGSVVLGGVVFDRVHPGHRGPNTVHMTRVQIAELILCAGHHRVLDLPCGTGTLTQILLDGGAEAIAADLNPDAFLVPGRSCMRGDLNARLPFDDGEFDALGHHPPKLVDGDDPKSPLFLTNKVLTELPFPARHLVDVESYHYSIEGVRALSMIAQLGCPFGCGFCGGGMSPFLRRVRMRTSENIVQELVQLYETYGITGFMLYDDELNVSPKIVELMDLIAKTQKQLGVEFRLRGFIKAELFTDEQAEAMYRAGFR